MVDKRINSAHNMDEIDDPSIMWKRYAKEARMGKDEEKEILGRDPRAVPSLCEKASSVPYTPA